MWVDTTAMTGARAGVGTGTAEGREAEACIWAELAAVTWTGVLTETGA